MMKATQVSQAPQVSQVSQASQVSEVAQVSQAPQVTKGSRVRQVRMYKIYIGDIISDKERQRKVLHYSYLSWPHEPNEQGPIETFNSTTTFYPTSDSSQL